MPNRLASEASLYLRQHADNPVDWYPWGDEAFARAVAEDRPILLSVGYSSCHWCHVMAHESFEDPEIAALMNDGFVCIKVDREERPDVDALYMQATVAMSGHGGWPMTVFLTPSGEPFFAGTYFPPRSMHGRPGFADVLRQLRQAFNERRADVTGTAARVADALRISAASSPMGQIDRSIVDQALTGLAMHFDAEFGGFGGAPKFPPHLVLEFLIGRIWQRPGDVHARRMLDQTLLRIADGGIHDQLGGGFHRYSVDRIWLVPHFEKMLYDNALLAQVYSRAFRVTGEPLWREVAERTFDYLLREMRLATGGFAASQDADSPGGEGAYFVWTPAELERVLSEREAQAVSIRFGVTPEGNFDGATILHVAAPMDEVRRAVGDDGPSLVASALRTMAEVRSTRAAPVRDESVITAWNALAIHAFAQGAIALDRPDLASVATDTARLVLDRLVVDGRLHRAYSDGLARHLAGLDDHANLLVALLGVYEATFDASWVAVARQIADQAIDLFGAPGGGFFATGRDAPQLIAPTRDLEDHPTPAGNSQMALGLLTLSQLTGSREYEHAAFGALATVAESAMRAPHGFGAALSAIDLATSPDRLQVAIAAPEGVDPSELIRVARRAGPHITVAVGDGVDGDIELLRARPPIDGLPTAYVCRNETCSAPVHDLAALTALLESGR